MSISSAKYPSFNVTTGPVMPTGLDMQQLALDAASHLNDAPTDGQLYGRESGAWVVVPTGGGGGIADAPSDGTLYGRKSGAWVHLTHNDITDWAAQLANYYPTSNPAGYQTAAQVTASLGPYALTSALANYLPLSGGTVTGGTAFTSGIILASPVNLNLGGGSAGQPLIATGTGGQVAWGTALPAASTTLPLVDGVATIGTSGAFAQADHVHPLPPQAIGDNRIINGNFAVNQRGQVSGTALAAAAYGHDRWKAGASGCTYTFPATVPDTVVTITAGTLTQVIEVGMIEGGVYTLSWTGTAQARVYQGTPSGSYAASPVVTTSLPAGANTIVEFNAGTLNKVKFESGSVATPFNRQSLAKSLADCQRYYGQYAFDGNSYQVAGGIWSVLVGMPVTMRATPTVGNIGTPSGGNTGAVTYVPYTSSFKVYSAAGTTGAVNFAGNAFASAEL